MITKRLIPYTEIPPNRQDPVNYSPRADYLAAYIPPLASDIGVMADEFNATASTVNSLEQSSKASKEAAELAAQIANSSANIKGAFQPGTTNALHGETWLYDGSVWYALVGTSTTPSGSSNDWVSLSKHSSTTGRDEQGAHPASAITLNDGNLEEFAELVKNKLVRFVTPEDFGGISVNNSIIAAMNAAAELGVPLVCSPVEYQTSVAVIPPSNLLWQANGCTLKANTPGGVPGIKVINDNLTISGALTVDLSYLPPPQTANRGHILVGDWSDPNIKPSGFFFDEIYIKGGHDNANGFAVAGAANNIRGKSIRCGDSALIGRLLMTHWGNFSQHFLSGGTYQHASGAVPTTHPNNIIIDEVSAGNISGNTGDFMAIVAISAGYDTWIKRINGNISNVGAGPANVLLLTAGDLGMAYGTSEEKERGMWGLKFDDVSGETNHSIVNRIGQALYHNADSTPQPEDSYFTKIKVKYGSITGVTSATTSQGLAGTNGFGGEDVGTLDITGGNYCASIGPFSRDINIGILRCKNSILNALLIAGAGSQQDDWPQDININRLDIDGTASSGALSQENAIGYKLQSCKRVRIGSIFVKKTNNLGYVGAVRSNATNVQLGETFIDTYDSSLSFAYVNTQGYEDNISIGNVFGPAHITQPVSGGTTFNTTGRNKEYHSASGFPAGLNVNKGDRVWVTGGNDAMAQVTESGVIGSTAAVKVQLNY